MTKKITIDKAGRIIIPKPMRKALHLSPGDSVELDNSGEQITLRPFRIEVPLKKERGVWVFRSGQDLTNMSITDMIDKVREERSRDILG